MAHGMHLAVDATIVSGVHVMGFLIQAPTSDQESHSLKLSDASG